MKGLRQFQLFDFDKFCQGKKYVVTGVSPWVDFNTKQPLGTKIEVAIVEDKTVYASSKDGKAVSNLYEKMVWKLGRNINVPIGTAVVPVGAKASIYGDFGDKLSVTVTDIKAAQTSAPTGRA